MHGERRPKQEGSIYTTQDLHGCGLHLPYNFFFCLSVFAFLRRGLNMVHTAPFQNKHKLILGVYLKAIISDKHKKNILHIVFSKVEWVSSCIMTSPTAWCSYFHFRCILCHFRTWLFLHTHQTAYLHASGYLCILLSYVWKYVSRCVEIKYLGLIFSVSDSSRCTGSLIGLPPASIFYIT
jgi:hypothetical protein